MGYVEPIEKNHGVTTRHKGEPAKRISVNLLQSTNKALWMEAARQTTVNQQKVTYTDVVNEILAKTFNIKIPSSKD